MKHPRLNVSTLSLPVATACILLFTSLNASASIFVNNLVSPGDALPISGNQAWGGQLGDDFTTTAEITISQIGVFDSDGNGTTVDLIWRLYNVTTGALLFQDTISASGPRTAGGPVIESNYVFKDLVVDLVLPAGGVYSAVAVGFNSANPNFNTNFSLGTLDVEFSNVDLTAAGGRFSGSAGVGLPTADGAGNSASTAPYNFGAATFVYGSVDAIPEPTSVVVWSFIALLGLTTCNARKSN